MYFSYTRRLLITSTYLGSIACGLNGLASRVGAQDMVAPVESPSRTIVASATHGAALVADEDLRKRVETALHSDPYFYDAHITVSVKKGDVLLSGFVSSEWDLLDAIRIARKAAGNRRVSETLSIELGGRR
jgi:osmotically-inducible protein OsmY